MKVLVTGASGFVGRELVNLLLERADWEVVAAARHYTGIWPGRVHTRPMPDLTDAVQRRSLGDLVAGVEAVVHLAALTPGQSKADDISAFREANSEGTASIARACVVQGVKKFVLLSSSRISGATSGGKPIDENSARAPDDAYAISKLLAEDAVKAAAADGPMSWTIIRPPLIYGPGAKGQLRALTRAIRQGVPLPLGAITFNSRDMIGVRNMCSFIEICLKHPRAERELFVVRDGQPVSTRGLIEAIARAMDRPARLLPVPVALLKLVGTLTGRRQAIDRLVGNHQIDDAKARRLLDWSAEVPIDFDLKRMVRSFSS